MWPPELGRIADLLDERDEAPIAYEWFGDSTAPYLVPYLVGSMRGTRRGIAEAILTIPGVVRVGVADQSNDARIERWTVHICVVFDRFSMTDGPLAWGDIVLLRAEAESTLYESMPAGIVASVRYEDIDGVALA